MNNCDVIKCIMLIQCIKAVITIDGIIEDLQVHLQLLYNNDYITHYRIKNDETLYQYTCCSEDTFRDYRT